MNDASLREVLLLQAFESVTPPCPSWTDEDRAWATRLALADTGAQTARPEDFIAGRARHAMQRLLPREPALAQWLARRPQPMMRWVLAAVALGLVLGLVADSIGSSRRINLLAPPVWTVLLWNALVCLGLLGTAVMRRTRPPPPEHNDPSGGPRRLVERLLNLGRRLPMPAPAGSTPAGGSAAALGLFASRWAGQAAPVSAVRAATLLHAAAAALALGLTAGLYARGLVLDYRVGWESTFLGAGTVHAVLSTLLAPASLLTGIALPDAAGIEALRTTAPTGQLAAAGAPAAPWIHLYAATLLLGVVLPRGLLGLAGAVRAGRLARHAELPLDEPYFQRLVLLQRGDVARVEVLPYARPASAQAALGLRALLADVLGDELQLRIAPLMAFGAEDDSAAWPTLSQQTTLAIALFDLSATPEAENHGRFARRLAARAAAGAATIVVVDEAAFRRRFNADATRLTQRQDAWCRMVEAVGSMPVFADLESSGGRPEFASLQRAVQSAIATPVRRAT